MTHTRVDGMKITVIVCTFNRCQILPEALDTVAAQNMPPDVEWDILVVDNNSSDQTRDVMEGYCKANPTRFSYIFEPKQGLSHARNAGIRNARGDILAFTDDDSIADPDWLWNLTSSLGNGDWSGAGGSIVPVWKGNLPVWLSAEDFATMGPFGGRDDQSEAGPLKRPPFGGNMAFRREIFEKHGGFRVDLGRSANNLLGREDIEFGNRLFAYGVRLRYEPKAVILTPVAESRMTRRYLLRWYYWEGRSEIADLGPPQAKYRVMGMPLYLLRRTVRWAIQSLISTNSRSRFFSQSKLCGLAGQIVGCYHEKRHRQQRTQNPLGTLDSNHL